MTSTKSPEPLPDEPLPDDREELDELDELDDELDDELEDEDDDELEELDDELDLDEAEQLPVSYSTSLPLTNPRMPVPVRPDELDDELDDELEDELDDDERLEPELAEPPLMKLCGTERNFSLKKPEYPGSASTRTGSVVWILPGSTRPSILVVPIPATRFRSALSKRGV